MNRRHGSRWLAECMLGGYFNYGISSKSPPAAACAILSIARNAPGPLGPAWGISRSPRKERYKMIRSPRASTRRWLVAALLLPVLPATAQVLPGPTAVNIQGRLTQPNGAAVPDGPHAITVSLWDAASGGNQKFSETLSAVNVSNGLFNVRLRTLTPGKLNGNLWVQWKVDGDAAMTPRIPLGSVATALKANTVPDGSIGSAQLALDATSLAQVSGNALRASTSGNIGIGTTAGGERVTLDGRLAFARVAGDQIDAGKLDYRGFDTGALSIVGAGAAAGNRAVRLYDRLSIGYATPTSGAAVFNGAVGIGTATPGAILDVQAADAPGFTQPAALFSGSSAGGTWLKLHNTAVGGHQYAIVATGPGNGEGAGNLLLYDQTALTPRMILTGSGDVGIGTVSPSSELDVNGEITAKIVTVTGGSDVAEPYTVARDGGFAGAWDGGFHREGPDRQDDCLRTGV